MWIVGADVHHLLDHRAPLGQQAPDRAHPVAAIGCHGLPLPRRTKNAHVRDDCREFISVFRALQGPRAAIELGVLRGVGAVEKEGGQRRGRSRVDARTCALCIVARTVDLCRLGVSVVDHVRRSGVTWMITLESTTGRHHDKRNNACCARRS